MTIFKPPAVYLTPAGANRDRWTAEGGYSVSYVKAEQRPAAYLIGHESGDAVYVSSLGAVLDAIEAHVASGKWELTDD